MSAGTPVAPITKDEFGLIPRGSLTPAEHALIELWASGYTDDWAGWMIRADEIQGMLRYTYHLPAPIAPERELLREAAEQTIARASLK